MNPIDSEDLGLQELKEQYQALKSKADRLQIATDALVRKSAEKRVNEASNRILGFNLLSIVIILVWPFLAVEGGLSPALTICGEVAFIADVIIDRWALWPIRGKAKASTSLKAMAEASIKARRRFRTDLIIGVVISVILAVWIFWELVGKIHRFPEYVTVLIFSIGTILGLAIARRAYLKIDRDLRGVEQEIREYQNL